MIYSKDKIKNYKKANNYALQILRWNKAWVYLNPFFIFSQMAIQFFSNLCN